MVSSCCVKGCSEKFVKGGGVSYFRISSKPEMQRNAWIIALKRSGWTPKAHHRICSRHFVTGTWNSDPNHIDYIPTRGMSINASFLDTAANSDSLDTPVLEHSIAPDSPNSTDLAGLFDGANGEFPSPHTSGEDSYAVSQPTAQIIPSRVPIMGVSSSQFHSASNSHKTRPRKMSRKQQHKWASAPKLTSSYFCEHQDSHRNCCRVIRELAEENQILKSQVTCLFYEIEKLRAQVNPSTTHQTVSARNAAPPSTLPQTAINGKNEVLHDDLQDIEVVSESPPSLCINEDVGSLEDEGQ